MSNSFPLAFDYLRGLLGHRHRVLQSDLYVLHICRKGRRSPSQSQSQRQCTCNIYSKRHQQPKSEKVALQLFLLRLPTAAKKKVLPLIPFTSWVSLSCTCSRPFCCCCRCCCSWHVAIAIVVRVACRCPNANYVYAKWPDALAACLTVSPQLSSVRPFTRSPVRFAFVWHCILFELFLYFLAPLGAFLLYYFDHCADAQVQNETRTEGATPPLLLLTFSPPLFVDLHKLECMKFHCRTATTIKRDLWSI